MGKPRRPRQRPLFQKPDVRRLRMMYEHDMWTYQRDTGPGSLLQGIPEEPARPECNFDAIQQDEGWYQRLG